MKTYSLFLCVIFLLCSGPVQAEIIKTSVPCNGDNCLYWSPRAPSPPGWHQDQEASDAGGINAQAPDGSSFRDAETVIYAKAMYKPLVPTLTSLALLISEDKKDFLSRDPKLSITESGAMPTADGVMLKSFTFIPGGESNWEEVAYGEENDFFLIFTLSSRSQEGLAEAREAYRKFVRGYQSKP